MKLSDSTILVTGGGSGIGLALAKAYTLHSSNTVIVCGRNAQKLETVHKENPAIVTFPCDIARDQDQLRLIEVVTQKYPNLNILINNAGIQHNYNFPDTHSHTDLIEEEVNINFLAHVKLTDRLLPVLLQQPRAAIVNVTSSLAVVPKQSAPIYCATKAAMHNFTKALRYQLENTTVKVFEIIPALVDTEMTKGRGKGKITPEALAAEALRGIESNKYEIRIEKTKILLALHRLLPSVVERIIRNG
jgi:short-subunit dehydrogenase involved in D-alanine esterification of teichoic acids